MPRDKRISAKQKMLDDAAYAETLQSKKHVPKTGMSLEKGPAKKVAVPKSRSSSSKDILSTASAVKSSTLEKKRQSGLDAESEESDNNNNNDDDDDDDEEEGDDNDEEALRQKKRLKSRHTSALEGMEKASRSRDNVSEMTSYMNLI
jgi:hypothetical protein